MIGRRAFLELAAALPVLSRSGSRYWLHTRPTDVRGLRLEAIAGLELPAVLQIVNERISGAVPVQAADASFGLTELGKFPVIEWRLYGSSMPLDLLQGYGITAALTGTHGGAFHMVIPFTSLEARAAAWTRLGGDSRRRPASPIRISVYRPAGCVPPGNSLYAVSS